MQKFNRDCSICGGSGYVLLPDGSAGACECYRERSLLAAKNAAGLPAALQQMTFANFNLANYPGNQWPRAGDGKSYLELARAALDKTKACCEAVVKGGCRRGILLQGNVGSGKTHLAAAAVNYLLEAHRDVYFLIASDFFEELKSSFDADEETKSKVFRLQQKVKKTDTLVIDDLGSHNFSDWTRSVLFTILNYRMNEELTTIITTNLSVSQLQENLDNRLISWLIAQCQPCLLLANNDLRLQRSGYR